MVVIGLGSNLGDRAGILRRACREIWRRNLLREIRLSPLYESEAMLLPGSPASWDKPFLNMALCGQSQTPPRELFRELQTLEQQLGGVHSTTWAPRMLDIDILAWGEEVYNDSTLQIPHPGLLERPFALLPLADLIPNWRYPVPGAECNKTVFELCRDWSPHQTLPIPFGTRVAKELFIELVGILNLTPDSFSDGGLFVSFESQIEHLRFLLESGASVVDIGAESTRPSASSISPEEEWDRLDPVVSWAADQKAQNHSVPLISVDTRHAITAARAIKKGVDWINDVTGFESQEMVQAVRDASVDLVVMHSLGIPPRRDKVLPNNMHPIEHLLLWGEAKLNELETKGIRRERIILDPGIGFGKSAQQSLGILREAYRLQDLGVRVMIGHSRKSFLSAFTEREFADRDLETLGLSAQLAQSGIDYLRVHNVADHMALLGTSLAANPISLP